MILRGIGAFPLQRRHYYLKNDEWKKIATTLWVQVAQGEYVAPETLEEIYSKSNFIAQVSHTVLIFIVKMCYEMKGKYKGFLRYQVNPPCKLTWRNSFV